jgi:hypothetical protein
LLVASVGALVCAKTMSMAVVFAGSIFIGVTLARPALC